MLGKSIGSIHKAFNCKFSPSTVYLIGLQILDRLEVVHNKGIVHRDLKPDNFLLPKVPFEEDRTIYLIDFGLSKRYKDLKTGMHIPYRDGKSLTGTPRFASLNTHLGMEHSRRDDLESLAYVLIYLYKGKLPWQGLYAKHNAEKEKIVIKKYMKTPLDELCSGLSPYFIKFLTDTRNLRFDERPNYNMLKGYLMKSFENSSSINEIKYDWEIKKIDEDSDKKNNNSNNNEIKNEKKDDKKERNESPNLPRTGSFKDKYHTPDNDNNNNEIDLNINDGKDNH